MDMNFIDKIMKELATLETWEIIDTVSEKWGSEDHGITEEKSLTYPQFIQDLLHIVDFDIACNWDGLEHFIRSCDKLGYLNTIKAFENIQSYNEAHILSEIRKLPTVTAWHNGKKIPLCEDDKMRIENCEKQLYCAKQDTNMWELLEKYISAQKAEYGSTQAEQV